MCHKFLTDASFHAFLVRCDEELAREAAQSGCKRCGGRLDSSNYPRSPFGVWPSLRSYYEKRFSFCCRGCRKRVTTPSMRFCGRRWYVAPILLLVSALTSKRSKRAYTRVCKYFGIRISLQTWARWRLWWQEIFVNSSFWQQAKGQVNPCYQSGPYPYQLFYLFSGSLLRRLLLLLRFLSPMTAGY